MGAIGATSLRRSWAVGARSETGYVREENEDRMTRVRFPAGSAYIVSDGLGGHNAGAKAAELTVNTLTEQLSAIDDPGNIVDALKKSFDAANSAVYQSGHSGDESTAGMGATAVLCVTSESSAVIANVGDSRAYLHRRWRLTRLTRDHTRVQRMVDEGILTQEDAEVHPDAGVLLRAIGSAPNVQADIGDWLRLEQGDEILLCSDGLCGAVEDEEIQSALRYDESPRRLVDRLVGLALEKGGADNVTVQLIRYGTRRRPFDWSAVRAQLVVLPVLLLGCAATIYLVNAWMVRDLSARLDTLQSSVKAAEASAETRNKEQTQELSEVKAEVAKLEKPPPPLPPPPAPPTLPAPSVSQSKDAATSQTTASPRQSKTHKRPKVSTPSVPPDPRPRATA